MITTDRRFGIEFEFGVPQFGGLGYYDERLPVLNQFAKLLSQELPGKKKVSLAYSLRCWNLGTDCGGMELRSPPMTFRRWDEVVAILRAAKASGAYEGQAWGTHVHIERDPTNGPEIFAALMLWLAFESALRLLIRPQRRGSHWCSPPSCEWHALRNAFLKHEAAVTMQPHLSHPVPVTHGALRGCFRRAWGVSTEFPTYECRLHHCTLSAPEIRNWIMLLQVLTQEASALPPVEVVEEYRAQDATRKLHSLLGLAEKHLRGGEYSEFVEQYRQRLKDYSQVYL